MPPYYTESTLRLPDGIDICHTDSGAPSSTDHTTLIVLHGSAFNSDGFSHLHEYAHKNNLRIIAWNRRDYRGSTKYTDEELADLKAGRKVFLDRLALQLGWFLEHFIKQEGTPELGRDRKTGGSSILGWSFGNATTMALFADPAIVPRSLYETIEPYIMSLVLYDPPHLAFGYPEPNCEGVYYAFNDPDYPTAEETSANFQQWVSSYYTHPDIASGNPATLDYRKRTDRRTLANWTPEQKELYSTVWQLPALNFPRRPFEPLMQATLSAQAHKVLFEEKLVGSFFPNVHVFHIPGAATCWMCIWAYMESTRMYDDSIAAGQKIRPTTFHLVEDKNHFFHYDFLELFLQHVIKGGKSEYKCTKPPTV